MKGTTFENELRRIFDDMECFEEGSMKYVGRAFYGKIDDELRLKAQYISRDISNHYSDLKLEVIKRNEGVVDSNVIRFEELWGKKHTTNPNFKEGVSPHLWHSEDKLDWYVYHPTTQDMKELRDSVEDYVSVYQDFEQEMDEGMSMT